MTQDYRSLKDIDVDELIRQVRSGTLPQVPGGPVNELRRWRAYLSDSAHEIFERAVGETRALTADENRSIAQFVSEAQALEPMIDELVNESRKALAGELHPITQPYGQFAR